MKQSNPAKTGPTEQKTSPLPAGVDIEELVALRTTQISAANADLHVELNLRRKAAQTSALQLETLTRTLKLLAAEPERDRFIGQVLKSIAELLGAESSGFWSRDNRSDILALRLNCENGEIHKISANAGLLPDGGPQMTFVALPGLELDAPYRGVTIYDDIESNVGLVQCKDHLLARGIRALILIPLFIEDELIGSFSFHSKTEREYRNDEIELAQALAQQAGLAMQLARVAEQGSLAAVMEERNRLARDMHDRLAQSFTGMLIQLGVAQRIAHREPQVAWNMIDHIEKLARMGLAEVRRSVWALQPDSQEFSDLVSSLPKALAVLVDETGIEAGFSVHGEERSLPADIGMNLLRIAQEAVTNAVRHSECRHIYVELWFDDQLVRISIQDDGRGFDLRTKSEGGGFGFIGMRQRAERMGGTFTVRSAPGTGTDIQATATIEMPAPAEDNP